MTRQWSEPEGAVEPDADDAAVTNRTPGRAMTVEMPIRQDPLASTVVIRGESTAELDAKRLEGSQNTGLPFRPGQSTQAQWPQPGPALGVRPGEFTGTVTLSPAELLHAEAQAALPFNQGKPSASFPSVTARGTEAASTIDLPDALRAHLAGQSSASTMPAKTIGEALVTGARPSITNSAPVRFDAPLRPASPEVQVSKDAVILLHLHRPSMQRILRKPAWQSILDALDDRPIDAEADDPALSEDPTEIQEQAQAYAILKQGRCIDELTACAALDTAANKPGRFAPPLELVEGDLEPTFDDVEMLRAWVAVVPLFASRDERLQAALGAAMTFLDAPGAAYTRALARRHEAEIRQAYTTAKPSTRLEEVESLVTRALLEKRHYFKQQVLGGDHVRALLHEFGSSPVVVYIPVEAAMFLPLEARFRARIVAEIHFGQDSRETGTWALRSVALGRIVQRGLRSP